MEFNPFLTSYEMYKKGLGRHPPDIKEFYTHMLADLYKRATPAEINQLIIELMWHQKGRPYYHVYPGVIKGFLNLRLDIPINQLIFPEPVFAIKFAKNKEPFSFEYEGKKYATKAMVVSKLPSVDELEDIGNPNLYNPDDKILMYLDIGENLFEDVKIYTYIAMPFEENMTIEEAIHALPLEPHTSGPLLPDEARKNLVKIMSAICLLGDDVDLKEFDVLNKDLDKYLKTHDLKYIEKAKRRGKFGWVIGRRCEDEKSPTYVNPHFQHYHIGKGRTKIILKHKQGFFVKKEKIKKVPTGYEDN